MKNKQKIINKNYYKNNKILHKFKKNINKMNK